MRLPNTEYFENLVRKLSSIINYYGHLITITTMLGPFIWWHAMTSLLSRCRNKHRKFKAIFINSLVIWDKVALHELDIVHWLTQNTGNVALPDMEYF